MSNDLIHILTNYSLPQIIDVCINYKDYYPDVVEHFKTLTSSQRKKAKKGRKSSLRKARSYAKNRFKNKENFTLTVGEKEIPLGLWLTGLIVYVLLIIINIFMAYRRYSGKNKSGQRGKLPWIAIILIILSYLIGLGPLGGIAIVYLWPSKNVWPLKN